MELSVTYWWKKKEFQDRYKTSRKSNWKFYITVKNNNQKNLKFKFHQSSIKLKSNSLYRELSHLQIRATVQQIQPNMEIYTFKQRAILKY
jgi:hypothetical protein